MPADSANIARHLPVAAVLHPSQPAVKIPRGRTRSGEIDYLSLTFADLNAEVDTWCGQLSSRGVRPGDRTLVMVRQGLPLITAAFALFKLGAVPVVIDPGMGLRNFLACVARSRPRVLLGIPFAQLVSRIFRPAFRSIAIRIGASSSITARLAGPRGSTADRPTEVAQSPAGALAAIFFTSGSTGSPKGVCYEHGMFDAQVRLIRDTYDIEPGEIDLPMLPIFALFDPALGMTAIVPELDPRRPAAADPAKLVQAIQQQGVTNAFGSPTLWRKIGDYCLARGISLPSLRRVLCAGAPIPDSLWADAPRFIPGGKLHSPYGATEVLPVSTVTADAIKPGSIRGACVGRPLAANQVKIIALTDGPILTLADAREMPRGEIGEIVVTGPTVTKEYDQMPEETRCAKIQASAGAVWHRMGDCGYVDAEGCLWFCGRAAERLETANGPMFTEPCEQVFRSHPSVGRCALIGLGRRGHQVPAIVVELRLAAPSRTEAEQHALAGALRQLALGHPHTSSICRFYFHPRFPVDVRHNAKIHRLALTRWAATRNGISFRE